MAVLMVVAYHANLPVPGGFVGVDVFFVISGFVITAMLKREWGLHGTISFRNFYLRRFKRLVPALALMVTTTMVLSAFILSPLGPQQVAAATGLGALALSANLVIDRISADYFAPSSETNPLLNTWSLSVEEQFYIVFPLLLVAGWLVASRRGRPAIPILLIAVLGAVSFALACWDSLPLQFPGAGTVFGFYSPVVRAWEFCAGALLALLAQSSRLHPSHRGVTAATAVGFLGASGLLLSLWIIGPDTPFPGLWTLLPVLSTAAIIWSGQIRRGPIADVLSSQPLVSIGNWSYSIYLWHWPIIVFAVLLWPSIPLIGFIAALASFAPAILSYKFVEVRARNASFASPLTTTLFLIAVIAIPVLASLTVWITANNYWKPRVESGLVPFALAGDIGSEIRSQHVREISAPCSLVQLPDVYQTDVTCVESVGGDSIDFAILGDSHALHLFPGFAERFPRANILASYMHYWPTRKTANSNQIFQQVAEDPNIRGVLVSAAWIQQEDAADPIPELRTLVEAGKSVFVTDDVPAFPFDAGACKFQRGFLVGERTCNINADEIIAGVKKGRTMTSRIQAELPEVNVLESLKYFCPKGVCTMAPKGELYFEDSDHLNVAGSHFVAGKMLDDSPDLARLFDDIN